MMAQVGSRRVALAGRRVHASGSGCSVGWRRIGSSTRTGRVARRPFASGLLEPGFTPRRRRHHRPRRRLDPVRRAVADADLVRPVRRPRAAHATAMMLGFLGIVVAGRRARDPDGRHGRDGRRPPAHRRRLPVRPLPDLRAHRRAAHRHRHLRPVPAGLGPDRLRLPRADRRVAAAGPRLDAAAGCGRRRAHARSVGRPRRRRAGGAGRSVTPARSATARSRWPSSWSR